MFDLLDIAPPEDRPNTVPVIARDGKGYDIQIWPIDNDGVVKLARRFPELRKSLFGGAPPEVQGTAMLEAMPAIIAAGTRHLGDAAHEDAARKRLSQPEMMKLGAAIMNLTYPTEKEDKAGGPLGSAPGTGPATDETETTSDQP